MTLLLTANRRAPRRLTGSLRSRALCVALTCVGCATPGTPYLAASAGLSAVQDVRHLSNVRSDTFPGPSLGVALGYPIGAHSRLELELSHRTHRFGEFTIDGGTFGGHGDLSATAVMLNSIVDFPLTDTWTGFAGGGFGWARIEYRVDAFGDRPFLDDGDQVLATQVLLGAGRPVGDAWFLTLGYRLLNTEDPRFTDADGERLDGEFLAHAFEIGMRVQF